MPQDAPTRTVSFGHRGAVAFAQELIEEKLREFAAEKAGTGGRRPMRRSLRRGGGGGACGGGGGGGGEGGGGGGGETTAKVSVPPKFVGSTTGNRGETVRGAEQSGARWTWPRRMCGTTKGELVRYVQTRPRRRPGRHARGATRRCATPRRREAARAAAPHGRPGCAARRAATAAHAPPPRASPLGPQPYDERGRNGGGHEREPGMSEGEINSLLVQRRRSGTTPTRG